MVKTLSEIKAEDGRDLDSSLDESTLVPGEGANFGAFSLSALWNWIKGRFTNVVEKDNMNAVTSNAVNSKLGDYVKTADIVDKVEKGNMNPVSSNAVNSKMEDYVKTADIVDKVEKGNKNAVTSNAVNEFVKKNNFSKSYVVSIPGTAFYDYDLKDLYDKFGVHLINSDGNKLNYHLNIYNGDARIPIYIIGIETDSETLGYDGVRMRLSSNWAGAYRFNVTAILL